MPPDADAATRTVIHEPPIRICDLPEEILHWIFELLVPLDYESVCACLSVCRLFHAVIKCSHILCYQIRLGLEGKRDLANSSLSYAQRNAALTMSLDRWCRLEFCSSHWLSKEVTERWDLQNGSFAQILEETGEILVFQLPSRTRGVVGRTLTLELDFTPDDLVLDPSQDLLVIFEQVDFSHYYFRDVGESHVLVHILKLATGAPHPWARAPEVLHHASTEIPDALQASVFEDLVGMMTWIGPPDSPLPVGVCEWTVGNNLLVWNWKTGELLADIIGSAIKTYTFLSHEHIMLGIIDPQNGQPLLEIWDLANCGSARPAFRGWPRPDTTGLRLHLPFRNGDNGVSAMALDTGTGPSAYPQKNAQAPFYTPGYFGVVAATFELAADQQCILVMDRKELLRLALGARGSDGLVTLQWHEWGPSRTRIIPEVNDGESRWITNGYRMIEHDPDRISSGDCECGGEDQQVLRLRLYDFSPATRFRSTAEWGGTEVQYFMEPETVTLTGADHPITTSLPFSLHRRIISCPPIGIHDAYLIRRVLLAEDGILIGVNREDEREGKTEYIALAI
ncbi:hypothetical protein PUNSTDRAFT_127613 [Punctularia strigosozonata HHB-11173 SS5]|uniref:uncharacterized protein n=1 Tax=Punctularia strigosozonata (strain HHB-11173) TaxID=741275 RepID=UPI000441786B|nr:uncharacterized protein PUNSTDRAFT_127613 [Punctularia strigosozonata HHB-11173 SS5]EIN06261.1 hypothetical protein PUNSTDRAFT_127613 [Punctularia strigosozonata HHB-11173 SS5]